MLNPATSHVLTYVLIALAAVAATALLMRGRQPVTAPGRPAAPLANASASPIVNLLLTHLEELVHQTGHDLIDAAIQRALPGLAAVPAAASGVDAPAQTNLDVLEQRLFGALAQRLESRFGLPPAPPVPPVQTSAAAPPAHP